MGFLKGRQAVTEQTIIEMTDRCGTIEEFTEEARGEVERARSGLTEAIRSKEELVEALEQEEQRQLRDEFDGERLVDLERQIAIADKAVQHARDVVALAEDRLRDRRDEYHQELAQRYRAQAETAVKHLHRKLREAKSASEWLVTLHKEANNTLGIGQKAVPSGIWYAGLLDSGDAGDGGPVPRWRGYADRKLRGEE